MATLAANDVVVLASFSGTERLNVVANHNQIWRWVFEPYADSIQPNVSPAKQTSRSNGPAATQVNIGPMGVAGNWTLYNDSSTPLTYNLLYANVTYGAITGVGAVSLIPANANVVMSPTGTGVVTINPATAGSMDNVAVGQTTRRGGFFTTFGVTATDQSGTPGNVTNNNYHGRCAIAAGASSVTVTNSGATTVSSVFAVINQTSADATLTQIVRIATASGSFTIYGNATATAAVVIDWMLVSF